MPVKPLEDHCAGGFTLIELMLVMLLITIILAVAAPRFESFIFQDPAQKVQRWMVNTVRSLRSLAVQQQQEYALVVDLDNNRMWITNALMGAEEQAAAAQRSFALPKTVVVKEVQFSDKETRHSGTAEIHFYPAGYADRAIIRMEDSSAERFSMLIEPLLPKVKYFAEWANS